MTTPCPSPTPPTSPPPSCPPPLWGETLRTLPTTLELFLISVVVSQSTENANKMCKKKSRTRRVQWLDVAFLKSQQHLVIRRGIIMTTTTTNQSSGGFPRNHKKLCMQESSIINLSRLMYIVQLYCTCRTNGALTTKSNSRRLQIIHGAVDVDVLPSSSRHICVSVLSSQLSSQRPAYLFQTL